ENPQEVVQKFGFLSQNHGSHEYHGWRGGQDTAAVAACPDRGHPSGAASWARRGSQHRLQLNRSIIICADSIESGRIHRFISSPCAQKIVVPSWREMRPI